MTLHNLLQNSLSYEYIHEYCNAIAEKILKKDQHAEAGKYLYKAIQAKKKADAKGALK